MPFKFLAILLLSFSLYVSAQSVCPCGKNGPSEWLNNPITHTVTRGIGAPLAIDVSAYPQFFRFIGAQKFAGVYGCTPSSIKYSTASTTLQYNAAKLVTDTTPTDSAIFSNLKASYRECTSAGTPAFTATNSYYYQPTSGTVVTEYTQISSSYPEGEKFTFEYDQYCRVISISETHNAELISTTTFEYNTTHSFFAHLPASIKTTTSSGETTQKFDYLESIKVVNRRLVTRFISTVSTSQPAPSTVEDWSVTYVGSRMTNAAVTTSSRTGTSTFQYDVEYDGSSRWNQIYSFNVAYPQNRAVAIEAKYPSSGAGKITELKFQGPNSQYTLQYGKL